MTLLSNSRPAQNPNVNHDINTHAPLDGSVDEKRLNNDDYAIEFEENNKVWTLDDGEYVGRILELYRYVSKSNETRWYLAVALEDEDETTFQCTFSRKFNPSYGFGRILYMLMEKYGKISKEKVIERRIRFLIKNNTKGNISYSNITECKFIK